jgi:hypothetical protein
MLQTKCILKHETASVLTYALAAALLAGPVHAQSTVSAQVANFPLGANIQVLLKTNKKLRGTRGADSPTGFALLDAKAGTRQLTFDEVESVKALGKSHTRRNVLIGVTIGVAVLAIAGYWGLRGWMGGNH